MSNTSSSSSSLVALKDVIYKLQLCLLDGIKSETQLLVAGSLLSKSDYHDVVTERSIAQMCGYPLCHNSLPSSEPPKKGRYTISLKEHKVYDLLETRMYCSTKCVVNSRSYEQSLPDERSLDFDTSKIDKVVRLFEDLNLKNEEVVGDLGLSNLSIKEKEDENAGRGVMSMEEWIGPSNAIEGYVPQHDRSSKNRSGKDDKLKREVKKQESMLDELNFTSSIIMQGDEYNVSKKPSGSKVKDEKLKREVKKQENVLDELNFKSSIIMQGDEYNISKKPSGSKVIDDKLKNEVKKQESMLDELNFTSSIIMQGDEYDISKKTSGSKVKDDKLRREVKKQESMFDELNFMSSIITQGDEYSISKKPSGQTKLKKKHTKLNDEEKCETQEPSGTGIDQASCSNGLKSCLKLKSCSDANAAAIKRNVTWADDEAGSNTKTQVFENETENHKDFGISEDQIASAEVRAQAEGQLVDSGDVASVDSVSEAGQLAPLEGPVDPEPAQVKWSKKTGIVESDFFDSEDSWFDTPPEEFVLDLSPFAKMFMSLFAWVSSSTLAYVYGGEDSSAEEHYSSINGREYPQKIFLADGRSSEIKLTLATCLARALPGLVRHLRLATPVSTIEYAMGSLLETMSFIDPLPALRMKQWHVFILLLLEALSVSRIPALAPQLTNTSFFHKVFEDGQIRREEYEVLKDLILPLGRAPQFAMQGGA